MTPVVMTIRVDSDLRKAFVESCNQNDRSASQELREFMRRYVASNGQAAFSFK